MRDLMDYFQFGRANIAPVVERMERDKAGQIAAAIAQSGQFQDARMSNPMVQDSLGAMMAAERGQLGLTTGKLGNDLASLKLLDAIQNPGGNAVRSGAGGMLYNSRTGEIMREPDPKMLKPAMPFSAVQGGVLNRETGEVKPSTNDPLRDYPSDDRATIKIAGDLAVNEAKIGNNGFLDPLEEQRIREDGQMAAKKRLYDRRFDPRWKPKDEESAGLKSARVLVDIENENVARETKELTRLRQEHQKKLEKNLPGDATYIEQQQQKVEAAGQKLNAAQERLRRAAMGGEDAPDVITNGGQPAGVLPPMGAIPQASNERVPVIDAATGKRGTIPRSQLDAAIASGAFRPAQ